MPLLTRRPSCPELIRASFDRSIPQLDDDFPRERIRPREFVKRWLHRSCCSDPSEQRSYQQNQVGDQQKREPTDAVKLRDVAIDREHG
jgi:hypothetical protein